MRSSLRRLAFAVTCLMATAAAPIVEAATQAKAAGRPSWWRQLQAGVEAFGGLIGVALIVLAAVVLLLAADRWVFDRAQRDEEQNGP
jgi:hypothetical protein